MRIVLGKTAHTHQAMQRSGRDEIRAGDHSFESHNACVVVDADSLAVLDGSRIDFVTEGLKQLFKFDNPNVESECGCGESFNVKVKAEAAKA